MTRRLIVLILTVLSGADAGLLWSHTGAVTVQEPAAAVSQFDQTSTPESVAADTAAAAPLAGLVEIRPPDSIVDALTAAGTIELISKRQVVLQVDGTVSQVAVREGDAVAAGDASHCAGRYGLAAYR